MTLNSWNGALTPNGAVIANSDASGGSSVVLTNGQLLIGSTGNAPVGATLTVGSGFMSPVGSAGGLELQPNNWRLLATQSASNQATLDLVNLPVGAALGQYNRLFIQWYAMRPATDQANLLLRVSANNGSSFATTGYLGGINYWDYNSATATNINSTSSNVISGPCTSASTRRWVSGYCFLEFEGGQDLSGAGQSTWVQASNNYQFGLFLIRGSGLSINAYRFLFSSGNITSGTVSIYGLQTVLP
jgi:hypothetical protein